MLRKFVSIALLISFFAMATSGLLMVVAVIIHLTLNYRTLLNHLKTRSVSVFGAVLVVILILLYGVSLNNEIPKEIAEPMDALAAQRESHK